jgi:hypothetical protein
MFGLNDNIYRRKRCRNGVVGHDHNLGRARKSRSYSNVAGDLALGNGHVNIARSSYHVDGGNRLGSVRHRGNRLSPSNRIDLIDACQASGAQRDIGDPAIGSWGNAQADLVDTSNAGRNCSHQDCRRVRGTTAGHVAAGATHGLLDPFDNHAAVHVSVWLVPLGEMKGFDRLARCLERGL